jgi:hypothetical protein
VTDELNDEESVVKGLDEADERNDVLAAVDDHKFARCSKGGASFDRTGSKELASSRSVRHLTPQTCRWRALPLGGAQAAVRCKISRFLTFMLT